MRKWATWWIGLACVWSFVGCGGEAERKGYSEPLRVLNRTEKYLNVLQEKLTRDDYLPVQEPGVERSSQLIKTNLEYSLGAKLKDEQAKQRVAPKLDQLQQVFDQQVSTPIYASPPDLPKARAGVEQCLAIVAEMKDMLGG